MHTYAFALYLRCHWSPSMVAFYCFVSNFNAHLIFIVQRISCIANVCTFFFLSSFVPWSYRRTGILVLLRSHSFDYRVYCLHLSCSLFIYTFFFNALSSLHFLDRRKKKNSLRARCSLKTVYFSQYAK